MPRPKRTTKDKLMDAAEKLFARRGFHGASLRDITAAAGVDLALVNYHFGSKKQLLAAVLERRGKVLNEERLRRLAEVRLRAAPRAAEHGSSGRRVSRSDSGSPGACRPGLAQLLFADCLREQLTGVGPQADGQDLRRRGARVHSGGDGLASRARRPRTSSGATISSPARSRFRSRRPAGSTRFLMACAVRMTSQRSRRDWALRGGWTARPRRKSEIALKRIRRLAYLRADIWLHRLQFGCVLGWTGGIR